MSDSISKRLAELRDLAHAAEATGDLAAAGVANARRLELLRMRTPQRLSDDELRLLREGAEAAEARGDFREATRLKALWASKLVP
jgi:hypothetical protein